MSLFFLLGESSDLSEEKGRDPSICRRLPGSQRCDEARCLSDSGSSRCFRSYGRGNCILYTGWGIRIPVKEKHREFTAFVSTRGQFEFNRMPFGLSNSQATYQRAVDQALRGCSNVQAFVDDTCVHTPSFDTHLEHLDEAQLAILKIEDEECVEWAFECTDCCINGKDMLRCILMTSSNCLLNNKSRILLLPPLVPKILKGRYLNLHPINISLLLKLD